MLRVLSRRLVSVASVCQSSVYHASLKRASVFILLSSSSPTEPHAVQPQEGEQLDASKFRVLFTTRASSLRHHGGEVCFPGGKQDPSDADELHAGLREVEEEIGIPCSEVQVLGRLEQIVSRYGHVVTPLVGHLQNESVDLRPNPSEVSDAFWVPVSHLTDPSNHCYLPVVEDYPHNHAYHRSLVHCFTYQGRSITGMTALLLLRFLEVAFQYQPAYTVHPPGTTKWMIAAQEYIEKFHTTQDSGPSDAESSLSDENISADRTGHAEQTTKPHNNKPRASL